MAAGIFGTGFKALRNSERGVCLGAFTDVLAALFVFPTGADLPTLSTDLTTAIAIALCQFTRRCLVNSPPPLSPSSAVGAGSENSFRREAFYRQAVYEGS